MYLHFEGLMKGTVQKWGNSLAVRIPSALAKEISLVAGSRIDIQADLGQLVVKPTKKKSKIDIEALIAKITPQNRHDEDHWGKPVGREIW
jgi:antitoxin MazE